jgi:circadian clock protein KaiC
MKRKVGSKKVVSKKKLLKKHIIKTLKLSKISPVEEYIKTGISGFDALFDKGYGVPSGMSILVEGGAGSGKTIFCLATLNGLCKQGKKCLYMSFEEPEDRLIEHMRHFNYPIDDYIKKGLLRVKRFDTIDVSRSVEALLSEAKKELLIEVDPVLFPKDFKPDFVVIDSLSSIASAFSGHESRFRIYMEQLFRYLEKNKITNFLIREVSAPSHLGGTYTESGEAVSFLSDGIIVIYNVIYENGERGSAIEVLKMRGTSFKKKIVSLRIIDKKGVEIYPDKILSKTKKSNFTLT